MLLLKETAHHAVLKLYSGNNDSNADYTKMFKKMVVKVDIKEKPVFNGDEVSGLLKYLEIEKNTPRRLLCVLVEHRNNRHVRPHNKQRTESKSYST